MALAFGASTLPGVFSPDPTVRHMTQQLMPLVAASQPVNALAFVADGALYGVGGFRCL
jgi:Na+-driven multidrug efflux pump